MRKGLTVAEGVIMRRTLLVLILLLMTSSSVSALEIGVVSVNVDGKEIAIASPKGEIARYEFDRSILSYEYILKTPYFQLWGFDGSINPSESVGVKVIPRKKIVAHDLVRFPFFSGEKDTIGFLFGSAGATGRSGQEIYFINIRTGAFIKIVLSDMHEPEWITENGCIVGYRNFDTDVSFGPGAVSWGSKSRVSDIVYFNESGEIKHDTKALRDLFTAEYQKIAFSEEEKALLQNNIMSDMQYRPLGEKVVDLVYYGFQIGKKEEVFAFLQTLNPVYAKEAKWQTGLAGDLGRD